MAAHTQPVETGKSGWSRFWANLTAFAEAMDMSETEWLQRRMAVLEAEVAALKQAQSSR